MKGKNQGRINDQGNAIKQTSANWSRKERTASVAGNHFNTARGMFALRLDFFSLQIQLNNLALVSAGVINFINDHFNRKAEATSTFSPKPQLTVNEPRCQHRVGISVEDSSNSCSNLPVTNAIA